jgi:hypothetical protein
MRFTQPRAFILAAVALSVAACHSGGSFVAPSNPEATVRGFMNAVKANSLTAMGELWGSKDGPASHWMDRTQMEQRLTVIRTYLDHDKYDIMPPNETSIAPEGRHRVDVKIYRKGCTPIVPFTLVRAGDGWLVWDVDLVAAGNPAVPCLQGGRGR